MVGPIEPQLQYGFVCSTVLQEKDGVLSFIRVVNKDEIRIPGTEPPETLPPGLAPVTIVMGWGGGLGTHETAFNIISPGGETQLSPQTWSFNLEAIHKTHTIVAQVPIRVTRPGVYWIEFVLNGEIKGRTPYQILYLRQQLRKPG